MPKKRNQSYISKPPTSVHPSITNRHNDAHHDEQSDKSVNDLLQQLRINQAASVASSEPRSDVNPQTVHPSLKSILQIPETPPLRPRPNMRPAMQGRRRPPGPATPRSWLQSSNPSSLHIRRASLLRQSNDPQQRPNLETLGRFPNFHIPRQDSLQHLALVQLAKNWDFHLHYDQYYLPLLPIRYKQLLLTYLAAYSPTGINLHSLTTLFANDSVIEDATGTEDLTHLDLSISIGRSLSLKDLKQFITATLPAATTPTNTFTPDSWDLPASLSPIPTRTLTHLSLSHPPPSIAWRQLLQLSPQLTTLTHLSLSHWPPPTLTPNSTTAYRSTPTGDISYGDHDLYSACLDNDFSGAAHVLRQLSRDTYCLQWLDLSGCSSWLPALAWGPGGIDWDGAWSSIEIVVVAQGWMPEHLKSEGRRWKDILHGVHGFEAGPSPQLKRANSELRQWLSIEVGSRDILQRIRGGKVDERGWQRLGGPYGHRGHVNEVSFEDLDTELGRRRGRDERRRSETEYNDYGGDEELRKNSQSKPKRTCRVEFEYGWEGWWIEDCLCEYRKF
ncbi:MAG: hypothetical protein Q9224_001732 [Gallowayella concinna]